MIKQITVFCCLILLSSLQACGSGKGSDRLGGKWRCDGRATFALMPEAKDMREEQITAGAHVLESVSLEIDPAAGILTLNIGPAVEKSPYTVSEEKHGVYVLSLAEGSAEVELQDADTLLLTDSRTPRRTLVFRREK